MLVPYGLVRPLLMALPPEKAHAVGLAAARMLGGLGGRGSPPGLECEVAGLRFRNPVGLAAGFDKNGVALPFWRAIGLGFFEFGTVTPRPQPGNDAPRLWRFKNERALGNRLGFPSEGAAAVGARLAAARRDGDLIGINLGKNKETPLQDAADDYVAALEATRGVADYFAVNVSSPNTPGLRELQTKQYLADLLGRVREAAGATPVVVKLSPDLDEGGLQDAAEAFRDSGCHGVIATNTTLARPAGIEFEGGLSGRPLAARAREVLAELRRLLPETPLVSVGGIDSAQEARARLDAGADLIQIYTGMVYEGPRLIARILKEL